MAYTEQYNGIWVDDTTGKIVPSNTEKSLNKKGFFNWLNPEESNIEIYGYTPKKPITFSKSKEQQEREREAKEREEYLASLSPLEREEFLKKEREAKRASVVDKLLEADKKLLNKALKDYSDIESENSPIRAANTNGGFMTLFPSVEKEYLHNTSFLYPEEEDASFLRDYFDITSGKISLLTPDHPSIKNYRSKFENLNNPDFQNILKYKTRSALTLWQLNPEWGDATDASYILSTPHGELLFYAFNGGKNPQIEEVYNLIKDLSNLQLAKRYPDLFDTIINYAIGEYYGKIKDSYIDKPVAQEDNVNIGASAWSKNAEIYKAAARMNTATLLIMEEAKKEGWDYNNLTEILKKQLEARVNLGGWNRLFRNIGSLGFATSKMFADTGSRIGHWWNDKDNYDNPQRDAANKVVADAAKYFGDKRSVSETTGDAERFDFLALLIYGNYSREIKDLMTDEEKAAKYRELQDQGLFSTQHTIEQELRDYLQHKEFLDEGFGDYIGTTLNKLGIMAVSTGIGAANFMTVGLSNIIHDIAATTIKGLENLKNASFSDESFSLAINNTLDYAFEEGLKSINSTLNNRFMEYAEDLESTGVWGKWVGFNQTKYKEGAPFSDEELNRMVDLGLLRSKEEGKSLKKDVGATLGVWVRDVNQENAFLDWGNLQDGIGVAAQMVGTQAAAKAIGYASKAISTSGKALWLGSQELREANLATASMKAATARTFAEAGKFTGNFLKTSGNILLSEAPVLSNIGLNLGYAKSSYDRDILAAEEYVNSEAFKLRVKKKINKNYELDFLEFYLNNYEQINQLAIQEFLKGQTPKTPEGQIWNITSPDELFEIIRELISKELYLLNLNSLYQQEKYNYLREAERQALIDAGMTHTLTSLVDGALVKTWQAALYGSENNWAWKQIGIKANRKWNKLLDKGYSKFHNGKTRPINTNDTEFLRKNYGIKGISTEGKIVEDATANYTKADFYKTLWDIAKSGFVSNYALDLAVGMGKSGYEGMMEHYLLIALDEDSNAVPLGNFGLILSEYYRTLQGQGLITSIGEARTVLDGLLGAIGGALISPAGFIEARIENIKNEGWNKVGLTKNLKHDFLKSIGPLNLTMYANENVALANERLAKNRSMLQDWLEEKGLDLFASLANMRNYNIGLRRATNQGDLEGQEDAFSRNALEVAYMVASTKGTEFYNTAMMLLLTLLEKGEYSKNKELIAEAIDALLNTETLELAIQDNPRLKETITFLANINFTPEMDNKVIEERWNAAIENAQEMQRMISDSEVNRLEAIRELADYKDPLLVHSYTQVLSYRDHLKRKVESYKQQLEETREELKNILAKDKTLSTLDKIGASLYNVLYKSRALINSKLQRNEALIDNINEKIAEANKAYKLAKKVKDIPLLKAILTALENFTKTKTDLLRKRNRLKEAQKYYRDLKPLEEGETRPEPFISAKDLLELSEEEFKDFIDNLDNISDEQYKEFLKILEHTADVSDSDIVIKRSALSKPDKNDNSYYMATLKLSRYQSLLDLVNKEINLGIVDSERFTNTYSHARNTIASSAFMAQYRLLALDIFDGKGIHIQDATLLDWKEVYDNIILLLDSELDWNDPILALEKSLRFKALKTIIDSYAPNLVETIEKHKELLKAAKDNLNTITDNLLSEDEKQILSTTLEAIEELWIDKSPTIPVLKDILNKGLEDSNVDGLLTKVSEKLKLNIDRLYSKEDLYTLLNQYVNVYLTKFEEAVPINNEILSPEAETLDKKGEEEEKSLVEVEGSKTTEAEDTKINEKDIEKEKTKSKYKAYFNSKPTITKAVLREILHEAGFHSKISEENLATLESLLKDIKEYIDPMERILNLIELNKDTKIGGYLTILKNHIELSKKSYILAEPKDITLNTTTDTSTENNTPNSLLLTKFESLPKELLQIYKDKKVLEYLQLYQVPDQSNVRFVNLRENDDYIGILLPVNSNSRFFSDVIGNLHYQLVGFIPKTSHNLFESTLEPYTIINSNGKPVEAKVKVNLKVYKDELAQPKPIKEILTTEEGLTEISLATRFTVANRLLKFHILPSSTETSINSAEYGTATQIPIAKTVDAKGKTLKEYSDEEKINFNSRTKKLGEIIKWVLTQLSKPEIEASDLETILNSEEYTFKGDTNGGHEKALANALFLSKGYKWGLGKAKNGLWVLTIEKPHMASEVLIYLQDTEGNFKTSESITGELLNTLLNNPKELAKWLIPHWYYQRTNNNEKYWNDNAKKVEQDVNEGLLQVMPVRVESADVTIYTVTDGSKLAPIITPTLKTSSPLKLKEAEDIARWNNFVAAMSAHKHSTPLVTIGKTTISRSKKGHIHRGSSGREGTNIFNPKEELNNLALSLAIGHVVDGIYRDIFNTIEGKSDYVKYKEILSLKEFDAVVEGATKLKSRLITEYGAKHFFIGDMVYVNPINGLAYGSPDIIFMDNLGRIIVVDVKTATEAPTLFNECLNGENLNNDPTKMHIYGYNQLVTEYAIKTELIAGANNAPIPTIERALIAYVPTAAVKVTNFEISSTYTPESESENESRTYTIHRKAEGKLSIPMLTSEAILFPIDVNKWRAKAWDNMINLSQWEDLSNYNRTSYSENLDLSGESLGLEADIDFSETMFDKDTEKTSEKPIEENLQPIDAEPDGEGPKKVGLESLNFTPEQLAIDGNLISMDTDWTALDDLTDYMNCNTKPLS